MISDNKETGTFVAGGFDDIMILLDNHIVKIQATKASQFKLAVEEDCYSLEKSLKYAQYFLEQFIMFQKTWMYLVPIFSSDDIQRQLPTESKRFGVLDTFWRHLMNECNTDRNFMSCSRQENRIAEQTRSLNQ